MEFIIRTTGGGNPPHPILVEVVRQYSLLAGLNRRIYYG